MLAAGAVQAADLTNPNAFPKNDGVVFLGADNTNIKLVATAPTEAGQYVTARIHYLDALKGFIASSSVVQDSDPGTPVKIDLTVVNVPENAVVAIITVDASQGTTDKTIGGQSFAYVKPDGTFVGAGADENAAIVAARAVNAPGLLNINRDYNAISVTNAVTNATVDGANPKVLYATFNADPAFARGESLPAGQYVDVKVGQTPVALFSSSNADITGSSAKNVHAFVFKDRDGTNAANTNLTSLAPFSGPIDSISNVLSSNTDGSPVLDDGAGNVPTAAATIDNITVLVVTPPDTPPTYNGTGKAIVATYASNVDGLYGTNGVAEVKLSIRLDKEPLASSLSPEDDFSYNAAVFPLFPHGCRSGCKQQIHHCTNNNSSVARHR